MTPPEKLPSGAGTSGSTPSGRRQAAQVCRRQAAGRHRGTAATSCPPTRTPCRRSLPCWKPSPQTDFNRYPDPLCTTLRTALAAFLDVPADDIVTGAGSLGALIQILQTFAGQNDDGSATKSSTPGGPSRPTRSWWASPAPRASRSPAAPTAATTSTPWRPPSPSGPKSFCCARRTTPPARPSTADGKDFVRAVPADIIVVIDEAYQEFVRDRDVVDGIDDVPEVPECGGAADLLQGPRPGRPARGLFVSQPQITQHLRVAATPFAVSSWPSMRPSRRCATTTKL